MLERVNSHRGWRIIQRAQRGHRVTALQEGGDVVDAGYPLARLAAPDRRHATANGLPQPVTPEPHLLVIDQLKRLRPVY